MRRMKKDKKMAGLNVKRRIPLIWAIIISLAVAAIFAFAAVKVYEFFVRETAMTTEEAEKATPEERQQAEGKDERTLAEKLIDEYQVAADKPRILTIPSINVKARILPMGVNPDNSMQAPVNIFDSGWYTGSPVPGVKSGNLATVIDAHASGPTREGLFAYLDTLENGAEVKIEMGDGSIRKYQVVYKESVPLDNIDMNKVLTNYTGVSEGLNMITCTGDWLKDKNTFNKREIVYTKRVE